MLIVRVQIYDIYKTMRKKENRELDKGMVIRMSSMQDIENNQWKEAGIPGHNSMWKSDFPGNNDSHYNDKTVDLYNGNPILEGRCLYIETAPRLPGHLFRTLPKLTRTRAVRYVEQGVMPFADFFYRVLYSQWNMMSNFEANLGLRWISHGVYHSTDIFADQCVHKLLDWILRCDFDTDMIF